MKTFIILILLAVLMPALASALLHAILAVCSVSPVIALIVLFTINKS